MGSSIVSPTLVSSPSSSLFSSKSLVPFHSSPLPLSTFYFSEKPIRRALHLQRRRSTFTLRAQTIDLPGSFFGSGFGSDDGSDPTTSPGPDVSTVEDKVEPQCPPGLRKYETMAVLRPDMSEDERLSLTQKYEELLVAGGGMYVEIFNRGVIPLAYAIKKKNKAGETNTYLDGIYLLFTYFTKPESMQALEVALKTDDDVVRSSSFKLRNRKY